MTKQEIQLFHQGWVSAKMAAERLGVHVVTIHRLCTSGKIKERDLCMVGRTRFIRRAALAEAHDHNVRKAFRLDDWSDVAEKMSHDSRVTQ
jgi:hypothetical protein